MAASLNWHIGCGIGYNIGYDIGHRNDAALLARLRYQPWRWHNPAAKRQGEPPAMCKPPPRLQAPLQLLLQCDAIQAN